MRVRRLPADVVAALVGAAALMLAGPASAQAVAPLTGGEPAVPPEVEQTEPAPEAAAAREPPPAPAPETPEPAAPVPAEPAFPGSGSQAGSPLQAYGERGRAGGEAPERARGWKVEPGAEGEDYVLFPPRALLFLPKLALELVFTPLEVLLAGIDRNKLVPRVIDLFYFDQAHTTGFYPTASSESGYGFSYGAKVFHNDVLGHEESASIKGTFGGRYVQAYELAFEGDRVGGSRLWLESRARYEVQPARLFFGLGNREIQATPGDLGPRDASIATRFRQERALGMLRIGGTIGGLGDLTKVGVSAIYNHRVFGPEERSFAEPSIETVYDTRQITGFRGGADTFELST